MVLDGGWFWFCFLCPLRCSGDFLFTPARLRVCGSPPHPPPSHCGGALSYFSYSLSVFFLLCFLCLIDTHTSFSVLHSLFLENTPLFPSSHPLVPSTGGNKVGAHLGSVCESTRFDECSRPSWSIAQLPWLESWSVQLSSCSFSIGHSFLTFPFLFLGSISGGNIPKGVGVSGLRPLMCCL